jgi:hypothetical protein
MHLRTTEPPNLSFSCFMNEQTFSSQYDKSRGAAVRRVWGRRPAISALVMGAAHFALWGSVIAKG